jgi:hypothetical protein
MQSLPVYLYPNLIDVILDLDDATLGVNRVMYQRDLKIQKGIKNQVRIQFKNSDQKRISISNTQTYIFSMFDATDQRFFMEKRLGVLDDGVTTSTRGLALLSLNESDTLALTKSNYQFIIRYQDPSDGTYLPTYANTYYEMVGNLTVADAVNPTLQPSQEITSFLQSFNGKINLYEHKSGNVYAYPEYKSNVALHTMALYMTNFIGKVYIQATMDNTPSSFGRYATIQTLSYDGFSGIDYVNFNGVFSYVRIVYIPARGPSGYSNDDPSYYGSFDKVLYRS